MADEVVLNKAATIERCLQRVLNEYAGDKQNLVENQTKQDAIMLNLQRACEVAIDLAMYVVSQRKLGVPPFGGQGQSQGYLWVQRRHLRQDGTADRRSHPH